MSVKRDTGVVLGAVALAGAAVLFAVTVTRVTLDMSDGSLPAVLSAADAAPATPEQTAAPSSGAPEPLPTEALRVAVAKAPFAPDRKAPAQRYLLPEQIVIARAEAPPPARPAAPEFRVLGTVAAPSGGVAVVQTPDGSRRVVSVGQEIEGYRVRAIEQAAVVMSGQGWDVTFAVADATPAPSGGSNQNARGQQALTPQARAQQAALAAVQAQRGAALERALLELRGAAAGSATGRALGFVNVNGQGFFVGANGASGDIVISAPPGSGAVAGKVVGGEAATYIVKPRPPGF